MAWQAPDPHGGSLLHAARMVDPVELRHRGWDAIEAELIAQGILLSERFALTLEHPIPCQTKRKRCRRWYGHTYRWLVAMHWHITGGVGE